MEKAQTYSGACFQHETASSTIYERFYILTIFWLRYENVWAQSIAIYREMSTAEGWTDLKVVDAPIVQRLTYNVALLMIMKCGFGLNCDWSVPSQAPDGSMSIHESIHVVTANHLVINFAPWLMSMPLPK